VRSFACWDPNPASATVRVVAFDVEDPLPNPVREGISFPLRVYQPTDVGYTIFDSGGRLVARSPRQSFLRGRHPLSWDGLTAGGNRAPAGVYHASIRGGGSEIVRRIVLVH
jgi:flagellar hook assembly protein FlgD